MAGLRRFFAQKISGLKKRISAGAYGIYYKRDEGYLIPKDLKINGHLCSFRFLDRTKEQFAYEFNEICLYDCYRLKMLKRRAAPVRVIVDIGANQGLFLIAARQVFPMAKIIGYEPNDGLRPFLEPNAATLKSVVHFEAVGKESGKVSLDFGESDLHTRSIPGVNGNVAAVSLTELLLRAGGKIDILKLDCEGAEWELFENRDAWRHIRAVTMEYHLWARPGAEFEDIRQILNDLGFDLISHDPLDVGFGLLSAIRKDL